MRVVRGKQEPAAVAAREQIAKARGREQAAGQASATLSTRVFADMRPADKDALLRILALQAGLLDE
jgi:hypothetical protein